MKTGLGWTHEIRTLAAYNQIMGTRIPFPILTALQNGTTILTANQRAARTLRRAFDESQRAQSAVLWTPPNIFALDTWFANLWHQMLVDGTETRLLLNPVQEHSIWRAIVAADNEVPGLRSVDALAEMAAIAWRLLHLYNGNQRLREFAVSTDTRAFARWAAQFERACNRNSWLSSAQLPADLTEALSRGNLPVPDSGLTLVDFDTRPPAHSHLFDSIRQAGFAVESLQTIVPTQSANLFSAPDAAAEMRAAARWAKQQLALNPAATIAIVVPNLADLRPRLDRSFNEILGRDAYEFSLGRSLAETSLAAAALDLLRWPLEPLPLGSISNLLLSPFFGASAPEGALAAAEFDTFELRRATLLRPELSLDAAVDLVARARRAPQLAGLLKNLRASQRAAAAEQILPASPGVEGPSQSHAGWTDAFRNLLEAAGWTAATQADSLTFQARRRWESALDQLATLDFDGTRVSAAAALKTLTRIVRQSVFAPESREAPVQIVGPLEPGGLPFDALWFLGADDRAWPMPAFAHPLIPWHIQRDLGIPGADPARDGAIAQTLTQRLAHSAPTVIFSFALSSEDGERRPSPLLRSLNLAPLPETLAEPAHQSLPFSIFVDSEPLPALAQGTTSGGARVLELQAACAFRAFAELRLHSTEPDSRDPGLDARDRGIHVHQIMQDFWTRLQSQDALRALPKLEREAILDACIEAAIKKIAARSRTPWEDAYLDVQRRRLRSLLQPWLDLELARPPFAVRQQEEKQLAQIGSLTLELRADRIDETEAGPLILDYKTGTAAPSEWLSDRPDAPQLPLYAVMAQSSEELGGVAFALLRAGDDLALRGFTDSSNLLPKPARMNFPSLAEQIADWRRVLTSLAFAFAEGDPVVDPKAYPHTCSRCAQRILCRLDPAALNILDEEETELTHG